MKQYKVITQKDRFSSGRFDIEKIEAVLNAHAAEGWVVKGAATAAIPGLLGGSRDEIIVILEKDKQLEEEKILGKSSVDLAVKNNKYLIK